MKGFLLRHLRWWAAQPDIFHSDGSLNIGYTYSNTNLCEDYTSPQSPYWSLKALVALGADLNGDFWSAEESIHPFELQSLGDGQTKSLNRVEWLPHPRHILCSMPTHHFLLSSGQGTNKRFRAREHKYGKFAYSSTFGFGVPTGPWLEQVAIDSTLAVCVKGVEDAWKLRSDPYDVRLEEHGDIKVLRSCWRPWGERDGVDVDVEVETMLVVPGEGKWEGWSVRVHCMRVREWGKRVEGLRFVDGGFAASAQMQSGEAIFEKKVGSLYSSDTGEGWWTGEEGALVVSESGASGVADPVKC